MGRAIVREPAVFPVRRALVEFSTRSCAFRCASRSKTARRLKTTSLYVTHDQVEAMTLAQRMISDERGPGGADRDADGRLREFGHAVCRGLHRSPSMNFSPGARKATAALRSPTAGARAARERHRRRGTRGHGRHPSGASRAVEPAGALFFRKRRRWSSSSARTRWSTSRTATTC